MILYTLSILKWRWVIKWDLGVVDRTSAADLEELMQPDSIIGAYFMLPLL